MHLERPHNIFIIECSRDGRSIRIIQDPDGYFNDFTPDSVLSDLFIQENAEVVKDFLSTVSTYGASVSSQYLFVDRSHSFQVAGFVYGEKILVTGTLARKIPEYDFISNQLRQSIESMEMFAYTVSHDLREPVRMVKSFMELLLKKYGDGMEDKAKSYIGFATDGAARLDMMIQDLLYYYRSTRDFSIQAVDLNEIIKNAELKLQTDFVKRSAILESQILPKVLADEKGISIVFRNILLHSITNVPDGRQPKIRISFTTQSERCVISLIYNGIDPDETELRDLFKLFYNRTQQKDPNSTLNGMAVAKRIVESSGGSIVAVAGEGGGTEIILTLPLAGSI